MTASTEDVSCYICGSSASRVWARENGWNARRCSGCGLVYVSPRPSLDGISSALQTGMHSGDASLDVVGRHEPRKVDFYRRRLASLYEPGAFQSLRGRWLDIGCGYGEFLDALALVSHGSLVLTGSEPNATKAAAARARGLDVHFRDEGAEPGPLAGISLLNVYGHLPDPPETLARWCTRLAPEGELLLQTGNWAELERTEIPDRLNLPDHLSFASEALVRRVLESAGFEVIRVGRFEMFRPSWLSRAARALLRRGTRPRATDLWFRARKAGDH